MKPQTHQDILMKQTYKRLLTIQVLSSLSTFLGPLVDGIVVSNFLGSEYMAAFGIIIPITVFIGAVVNIFNAGSQNVAGKYLGQGKTDKLNRLLTCTVLWASVIGLIITVILVVFSRPIVAVLGAEGNTIELCSDYVLAYAFGIIPALLMPSLVGFLQLDNGGKTAVVSSVVLLVADIILDLLAVLVFKNGMYGIGLATTISVILAVLVLLSHFAKKNISLRFTLKESVVKDLKKVVALGLPAATFLLCNSVRISVTNNIILDVSGLDSVAVFSIQNTFRPIAMAFTLGAGITALLVCSVISGEENRHSMNSEMNYILKLGLKISLGVTAVMLICAKYPFAILFCIGKPDEFTNLVASVIRLFALSIPFSMINSIFIYYYQSMRKMLLSAIITVLQNVVYFLSAAKILSMYIGVDGVWMGYLVSETLTILTIIVISWVKNGHFPKTVHDLLLLPDSFGVSAENRMNVTVSTIDEAIGISEKISEFCKGRGISERSTLAASLCMEELAVIAMENSEASNAYVDIFLSCKNGELKIRMMDNSRPFDKKLLAGIPDENDPCANVGVRIVKGLAKEINYNVVLGMNAYSVIIQ